MRARVGLMAAILFLVLGAVEAQSVFAAPKPTKAPKDREVAKAEEVRPPAPVGWELFEASDGSFSIYLPTKRRTAEAEDDGIPVQIVQARADDDCEYAVVWSDGADAGTAGMLPALLSAIAEGRGVSSEHGSFDAGQDRRAGLPGRKVHGASEKSEMDLRAYTDGVRLYKLYAVCPRQAFADTAGAEHTAYEFAAVQRRAFFGSFAVHRSDAASR